MTAAIESRGGQGRRSGQEQTDLLAEFEKVREDLQKIMDDLENSTFVKRFKAASREQLEVATAPNRTLFDGFGVRARSSMTGRKNNPNELRSAK